MIVWWKETYKFEKNKTNKILLSRMRNTLEQHVWMYCMYISKLSNETLNFMQLITIDVNKKETVLSS